MTAAVTMEKKHSLTSHLPASLKWPLRRCLIFFLLRQQERHCQLVHLLKINLAAAPPAPIDRETLLQGSSLLPDELSFINDTANGKNKKKYEDTKISIEKRFFQTLRDFGGPHLQAYLQIEKIDHGDGPVDDFALYRLCGGQKSPQKKQLLEYGLILCAMKWQCESGTNKGKPLQPCSFNTMMKQLSYVWKEKGIQYNFAKDFNQAGGIHGVLIKRWNEIRKSDPCYGTHPNKSKADMQYTKKLVEAISNGAIDLNDPKQLQLVVTFILGYYVGLRGSQVREVE